MTSGDNLSSQGAETPPVIRDRRKVDPNTGQVRLAETQTDAAQATEPQPPVSDELQTVRSELEERTEDLARAQAELVNYRRRVERDRQLAGESARAEVLTALLSVLDDIAAARVAEELTGPFAAVAEKFEAALARFGLERFGEVGQAFDPALHEALTHQTTADAPAGGPSIGLVMQPGYRMGERLLRAARVGVLEGMT
ncbi:MAG: nucleotide exchange factor GrpE [Bifidobacteriaceae bacterium]|nr:nucleotide exchange factor GrpE [Bifidobacteriaceae bacterium]